MGLGDEPLLADTLVEYVGQPIFAVAAETRDQARRAARLAEIGYEPRSTRCWTSRRRGQMANLSSPR